MNENVEVIDHEHEEKNFYAYEVEAKGIDIVTNMFYAQMENNYFLETTVIHLNSDKGILNIEMWATKQENEEIINYLSSFNDLLIREF